MIGEVMLQGNGPIGKPQTNHSPRAHGRKTNWLCEKEQFAHKPYGTMVSPRASPPLSL